ncbi:hypothetical protein [Candidatus Mycoplasma haematominutum]|nr:hypothetical protein [Candidatus Mycoplasma haematominutum]
MKGQSGVLVTFSTEDRENNNDNICSGVKKELEESESDQSLNFENSSFLEEFKGGELCGEDKKDDWKNQDRDKKEVYFGIYFEGGRSAGSCGALKDRDRVVIYVENSSRNKYTGAGFSNWNEGGECGVEGNAGDSNSFLVGRREDLMNLWLQKGKKSWPPVFSAFSKKPTKIV